MENTTDYESNKILSEYLFFHFGKPQEFSPFELGFSSTLSFPKRVVEEMLPEKTGGSALDLGCAVGGSSFCLSRYFDAVRAVDFSKQFIEAAKNLKEKRQLEVDIVIEGDVSKRVKLELESDVRLEKVQFEVGDACNLPADIGQFDFVLAANLICRLESPKKLIKKFKDLVKPDGHLVIASPYTWLEEFTKKDQWLGGYSDTHGAVRSLEALRESLESHFSLELTKELPFMIREHERKYQLGLSQTTRWKRLE